jgi:hypothetical protein
MTKIDEAKGAKFVVVIGIGRGVSGPSETQNNDTQSKNTKKNDTQSNGNQKAPVVMIP